MDIAHTYSETEAKEHYARRKASGLTIADYCRQNNIRPSTFYSWNKRFKKQLSVPKPNTITTPFVEIPVHHSNDNLADPIRIIRTEIVLSKEALQSASSVLHALFTSESMK